LFTGDGIGFINCGGSGFFFGGSSTLSIGTSIGFFGSFGGADFLITG